MSTHNADNPWRHKTCSPCKGGDPSLPETAIAENLADLDGWDYREGAIVKSFSFKNYYQTMAFVNAVAFMAHREDHHPDLDVGYNKLQVRYHTHAVGGMSDNDFICAAKVDALHAGD